MARSSVLVCESNRRDVLQFHGETSTAEFLALKDGVQKVSFYPSRNDVIRLRKALGEYLRETRKEKR